jgi:peptide/nickel transport system permease protein
MLNNGKNFMRTAPHLTIFPGLAIMITILAFNFIGDGLRDALDPRVSEKMIER